MNVRYRVTRCDQERAALEALVARGRPKVREVKRAQILLAADAGQPAAQTAAIVGTSPATIYRTQRAFVEEGLDAALHDAQRPGGRRKLSGKEVALLIATACSAHPPGRTHWTLELLADEIVRQTAHTRLSRDTVRRRLAESELKPWQEKMWCVPLINLSTHSAAALYDTFAPAEARRILRKLEIHYVPKHASWLNRVEIEIGVLRSQCLAGRIPDRETLVREIAAWEQTRNDAGARVHWRFTTAKAREQLGRVYRPLAEAREEAAKKQAA